MPSILTRIIFFLSSFSPLLIVFALLDTWGRGAPSIVCVLLSAIAACALMLIVKVSRQFKTAYICAKVARSKDTEALTYLASFLVPFLTVSADSARQRIAVGIFMFLIALFYIVGETYFWNPVLSLFGYRAIEIELGSTEIATLITYRRHIPVNSEIHAVRLAYNIFLEPRDG
jgi:hypothetical protein